MIGPGRDNDRGPGPRSTPTVDGDRLFVLTENGDLAALRATDGGVVWQRNILRDFNGQNISWLLSESPLVDGDKVIVTPGGRGAGMVALDKATGKDRLGHEGVERRGGLLVADRRRRGGRPDRDDTDRRPPASACARRTAS